MRHPAKALKTDKTYPKWLIAIILIFGVAGILFTGLAVPQIINDRALRQSEHIVEARVTKWDIEGEEGGIKKHQIRYTFVVDGAEASFSDATRRKNLWVPVTEDVWHKTKATRTIEVRYDPANIFNNALASDPIKSVDTFVALGLGILCLAIAVAAWFLPQDHTFLVALKQYFEN